MEDEKTEDSRVKQLEGVDNAMWHDKFL